MTDPDQTRVGRRHLVVAVLAVCWATPVVAQEQHPESEATPAVAVEKSQSNASVDHSFRSLLSDVGHELLRVPSRPNAVTLGIGAALALAVHPADHDLTARMSRSEGLDSALEVGALTGSGWVQVGGALGAYVASTAAHSPRGQALGIELVEAQVVDAVLTQGIKFAVRRTRPDQGRFSFPSGHASASFATAAVLEDRLGWKVGVPAYALATYVAASRLQENRHFASDVIFGAALGIVSARTVIAHRPSRRFGVSVLGGPGDLRLFFVMTPARH